MQDDKKEIIEKWNKFCSEKIQGTPYILPEISDFWLSVLHTLRTQDLERYKQIILRRTEIPKGARNPTRDATVLLGEELVSLLDKPL